MAKHSAPVARMAVQLFGRTARVPRVIFHQTQTQGFRFFVVFMPPKRQASSKKSAASTVAAKKSKAAATPTTPILAVDSSQLPEDPLAFDDQEPGLAESIASMGEEPELGQAVNQLIKASAAKPGVAPPAPAQSKGNR